MNSKFWLISKIVESQRAGLFRMPCDFMGPEEKSSCSQSWGAYLSPPVAGVSAISSKLTYSAPAGLCGWPKGDSWKADLPPMLAAQS